MKRVKLIPEHFKIGKYSGTPRNFEWYESLKTLPRGGEDILEYWYTEDPDESEYLDETFQRYIDNKLEKLKAQGWNPDKQFAYCISQSHLDLGWMWHFRQGVAKAETTFSKLHHHFQLFAPFTFTGSQPAQYQWVKMHSQEVWKEVKDDVERRRHELQGGSWCEADGRMPSGEAWVRQRLYGQLFYARNFSRLASVAWFPDSFGYANNLPQIFAKSGADAFFTAKLVSNKETKWPFWAWWWESPDGSRLLSYLTGSNEKIGPFGGFNIKQPDSEVPESYLDSYKLLHPGKSLIIDHETDKPEEMPEVSSDDLPIIGVFFGEGDGGHGPQGKEVAICRAMVEREVASWCNTREFYDLLGKWGSRLPVWKDELYYEFHRGSLTTQTLLKRMNRFFEWSLPACEGIHSIASVLGADFSGTAFDKFYLDEKDQTPATTNPIEQIWQNVLLMQFHDVLSGTSIPEVYDECHEFWFQDKRLLKQLFKDGLNKLTGLTGTSDLTRKKVKLNEPLKIKTSFNDVESFHEIDFINFFPLAFANTTGAEQHYLAEIPESFLNGDVPLFVIFLDDKRNVSFEPVQRVKADVIAPDLDKKLDHYIFKVNLPPWSTGVFWVSSISKQSFNEKELAIEEENCLIDAFWNSFASISGLDSRDKDIIIEESSNHVHIESKSSRTSMEIDKKSGQLISFKNENHEFLSSPASFKTYKDEPHREPCWNFMRNYWDYPIEIFNGANKVNVIEHGPVRWTVMVEYLFGNKKKSRLIIHYSITRGIPGVGMEVMIDFHETETLMKYELPLSINCTHSFAESPYATSRRKNNPTASHDIPRWEKWMHTFVVFEDVEKNIGLALINEGKYGYDTLNGTVGISMVHGPRYPETNIVAWARDERRIRKESGEGEPPTHADQGAHVTRMFFLPYKGTWRKGIVHHFAHCFNRPTIITRIDDRIHAASGSKVTGRSMVSVSNIRHLFNANIKTRAIHPFLNYWIKSSQKNVEVSALKIAENLPRFMDPENGRKFGMVTRLVNNSDEEEQAIIQFHPKLVGNFSSIFEVDLLERPLLKSENPRFKIIAENKDGMPFQIKLDFHPHEIRTFKFT
ncbi:MAG: glycoside hydrolase family 38 C-terminal domain-containing protein [Promethearchaeota archaeon]